MTKEHGQDGLEAYPVSPLAPSYMCPVTDCGKTFKTEVLIDAHLVDDHPEPLARGEIKLCGFRVSHSDFCASTPALAALAPRLAAFVAGGPGASQSPLASSHPPPASAPSDPAVHAEPLPAALPGSPPAQAQSQSGRVKVRCEHCKSMMLPGSLRMHNKESKCASRRAGGGAGE